MNAGRLILLVASERRDAQNERDGAGLRSSIAAATPSQLRRSSAARTMSGRRGSAAPRENLPPFGQKQVDITTTIKPSFFIKLFFLKSLGHSPDRGRSKNIAHFWGVKKSCVG